MMEDMRNQFLNLLSDIGFVDKSRGANVSYYFLNMSSFFEESTHVYMILSSSTRFVVFFIISWNMEFVVFSIIFFPWHGKRA